MLSKKGDGSGEEGGVSEYWTAEVRELTRWKREAYGRLLQRSKANREVYRRAKLTAKRVIRHRGLRADEEKEV